MVMTELLLNRKWWLGLLVIGMLIFLYELGTGYHVMHAVGFANNNHIDLTMVMECGEYDIEGKVHMALLENIFNLDQEIFEGREVFLTGRLEPGQGNKLEFVLHLGMSELQAMNFTLEGVLEPDKIRIKDNVLLAEQVTLPLDVSQWFENISGPDDLGNYLVEEDRGLKIYRSYLFEKTFKEQVWQIYVYLDMKGDLNHIRMRSFDLAGNELVDIYGYPMYL